VPAELLAVTITPTTAVVASALQHLVRLVRDRGAARRAAAAERPRVVELRFMLTASTDIDRNGSE
jgi:hypothetical protein